MEYLRTQNLSMKKLIFALIFLSIFPQSLFANFIAVTDSNYQSLSQNKPILAMFSLSCDMGGYAEGMFAREFSDVEGLTLGAININQSRTLYSAVYSLYQKTNTKLGDKGITLGTIILIHKGEVLHTTQMDYPNRPNTQYAGGLEAKRRWLEFALNKNKIPFRMNYASIQSDRVKPIDLSGPVDLDLGKLAHYDFENLKDKLGKNKDLILRGKAALKTGTLFADGKYDSNKTTAYFLYKNKSDEPYAKEFSLSLNFKTLSTESAILFHVGYKLLKVIVENGKLNVIVDPSYQRGTEGAIGAWSFILEETMIPANKWQNILISLDSKKRRVMLRLNGKRLDDLMISDRLADELGKYKPGANFYSDSLGIEFSDFSRGDVLHGYVDDLIIYNRLLSDAEQIALYRSIRPQGQADVEHTPSNSMLEANWNLLNAAFTGDTKTAEQAIRDGADINADNKKWTALMYASYFGHTEIVELLIQNKADVLRTMDAWTAQKFAESKGHEKIVKLLEDASNSREFYFKRSFPMVNHRSMKIPAELKKLKN